MKWDINEEIIVIKYYLNNVNKWRENIDTLMKQLKDAGFVNRDINSVRMRISNISSLHTGAGLSHASKQTKDLYKNLKSK